MKAYLLYLNLIFLGFLLSCEKEKNPVEDEDKISVEVPTVTTDTAIVLEEGGVELYGTLDNNDLISEHGFYYSLDSNFTFYSETKLGLPTSSSEFKEEIYSGLLPDRIHYFKSYIHTIHDSIIYGKTLPFTPLKNRAPIINGIIPEIGYLGDTISISGEYFGNNSNDSKTYFGTNRARILEQNDSLITCILPNNIDSTSVTVYVRSYNQEDSTTFHLYDPVIESVSAKEVTFGDKVTIFGKHFDHNTERNHLYISNKKVEISSSSRTEITFIVPEDLTSSILEIELHTQLQKLIYNDPLQIKSPEVSSVPSCTYSNSYIQIKGKYFHPDYSKNLVHINGVEAKIIDGNESQLTVYFPDGPYPNAKAKIAVGIFDTVTDTEKEVCIRDTWVMVTNTLPFSFYGDPGTMEMNNKAYVLSDPDHYSDNELALWEFHPESLEWTKHTLPFEMKFSGRSTSSTTKGYVYTATSENNFWELDPVTNQWKQLTDFIGPRRDKASMFTIDNEVYLGIGADTEPYTSIAYTDFYKYDVNTNQWSKISDFPGDIYTGRTETSTFVLQGEGYITCGARHTGMYDSWKYTPSTDQWTKVADFPNARSYTNSFVLDGKGYVANGTRIGGTEDSHCYQYDPSSNRWFKQENIGNTGRYRGFSFVVNGVAYSGGGYGIHGGDNFSNELYQKQ
ncbi:IPT/TIG domain-containing protein [Flammeovirga agarivorans]|uniref:IPT/TIG domain-containing protein n=1 Tax=Flammeovirga agarivorans TaxID=2726742 RepID=A0A7X8SQL1_9BACT|nr:IPT/TIG domain-containing protein [Flammeovirga agarivorans]NLR94601.1 hypothetical protein [Flammeovirga agarivorans]